MKMEFTRIGGEFTRNWVKSHSECIREYKGYSIVFGAFERTGNETFWSISIYRNSGKRMEHNAEEIWQKTKECLNVVCSNLSAKDILGLGITNQRETVVAFEKS